MRGGALFKGKEGRGDFRKNSFFNAKEGWDDCKQSLRAVLRTLIKIYTFAPNFKFGTK